MQLRQTGARSEMLYNPICIDLKAPGFTGDIPSVTGADGHGRLPAPAGKLHLIASPSKSRLLQMNEGTLTGS